MFLNLIENCEYARYTPSSDHVIKKDYNNSVRLISEIDKALMRLKDDTYGYCLDTAEPIGLKRLMARLVAKYTIAAQEKHEKDEKVHADD